MPYWHNTANMGWLGGLAMLVVMVLLLTALVTVTVLLVRRWERPVASHDAALRILNERFARGEIDQEEFEQRRTALQR